MLNKILTFLGINKPTHPQRTYTVTQNGKVVFKIIPYYNGYIARHIFTTGHLVYHNIPLHYNPINARTFHTYEECEREAMRWIMYNEE